MFFRKIDLRNEYEIFYKRATTFSLFFTSIKSTAYHFDNKSPIRYICDDDFFFNVINKLIPLEQTIKKLKDLKKDKKDHHIFIIIDDFPDDLYQLFILSKDPVYSFKMYLNDDKLDKLVKE